MPQFGLREAARQVGVTKSTIHRAVQHGRLSASRTESGGYAIDAPKLFRVYPPKASHRSDGARQSTDVDGGEPAVGRLDRGEPLLAQQRRQAALERAGPPLHPTPALRAVARDVLDAELLERPTHLGEAGLVYRLPGRGGVEVMAASVGVEGRKQSMRRNGLLETDEARSCALLLDQDSRE